MTTFAEPTEVNDLRIAFPASVSDLMPEYDDIPAEFRDDAMARGKWCRFQSDWFFGGLKDLDVTPKPGIDTKAALRHLKAIQGSFEPQHEHKAAAVAYLASLWFDDVKYKVVKP